MRPTRVSEFPSGGGRDNRPPPENTYLQIGPASAAVVPGNKEAPKFSGFTGLPASCSQCARTLVAGGRHKDRGELPLTSKRLVSRQTFVCLTTLSLFHKISELKRERRTHVEQTLE